METIMVNDPMSNFEIPTEMRQVAEKSLEDAKKAFDGFIAAAQKAAAEIEEQATLAQAGAKDVGRKAMAFAEQNVATSFDFAQKLARAETVEEMMRLQAEFVKAQMPVLSDQAKEYLAKRSPQRRPTRPSRRTKRALGNIRREDCDEPSFDPVLSRSDHRAAARASFYAEHRLGVQGSGRASSSSWNGTSMQGAFKRSRITCA